MVLPKTNQPFLNIQISKRSKAMVQKIIGILFICFLSLNGYAQEERIDSKGLQGEELVSLAIFPKDENIIFIGTSRGLYKKNLKSDDPWKPSSGLVSGGCRVNQILLISANEGYIATDRGLYFLNPDSNTCRNIFSKSDESERDCLSVALLKGGTVFVGTKGGVFYKDKQAGDWVKISSPFNSEEVVYLYGEGNIIYIAVGSGVYKSENFGREWEKVFNAYSYREDTENNSPDLNSEEFQNRTLPVRYITGVLGSSSVLYIATSYGIFVTRDAGKNWNRLPQAGLDLTNLRSILVVSGKTIFVIVKSGVYELRGEAWRQIVTAFDCKQSAQAGEKLILITSKDIFEYPLPDANNDKNFKNMSPDKLLNSFNNEPTIEEVQKMAIAYAEVSDKKIKDWRRRASLKAIMPTVSVGFNNNVYGSSSGAFAVGPEDWDVNLSWNLSDLVYNSDQTSIDTRSKLMAELRNDILAEATRIYFERRRLQIALMAAEPCSSKDELDKKLRLMELTSLLDRLTGGHFSNVLKSSP
jgi:photosystem II stability/assembly factor-like uncharacterized protein